MTLWQSNRCESSGRRVVGRFLALLCLVTHLLCVQASGSVFCGGQEFTTKEQFTITSNCTVIEGALVIRDVTLNNSTDSPLLQVAEISDYLLLYNVRGVASLSRLLPRLAIIRGQRLFASRYSVAIIGTELVDIGLRSLLLVERGSVAVFDNFQLCLFTIDWRTLLNRVDLKVTNETYRTTDADIYLHNNAPRNLCINKQQCPIGCPRQADWRKAIATERVYAVRPAPDSRQRDEPACWNSYTCQKGTRR